MQYITRFINELKLSLLYFINKNFTTTLVSITSLFAFINEMNITIISLLFYFFKIISSYCIIDEISITFINIKFKR